ncbi:hypothetical protein HO133_005650 [Letharia lupina]|uniref:Uncharacterized protein n=1 Tax=Letharia lupina TaxID=560253 RepID=A0A8H6C7Y8_9LECA|nr:uncharacterized protein HO133_005650 [Letharia lupina]KAF6218304.1 hypothetical protein HO133_005650 [Letharia lupina]
MEEKVPTVGQLSSGLVGEDPEAGVETVDIERIEKVYRKLDHRIIPGMYPPEPPSPTPN